MQQPQASELSGTLLAYWEQGWEGRIAFAFQPAESAAPHFLESGQRLSIYDHSGALLWAGRLRFVRRRIWDQHRLAAGIWSETKQAGVSYQQWMAWFWQTPPLPARLQLSWGVL